MTHDSSGRQISSTNTPAGQPADTSTTTFDEWGQVLGGADSNGVADYVYDGLDALGKVETRGLVTKVTQTSTASGVSHTATAAYDPQGAVIVETLPAGITRRHTWDQAGELVDLSYTGPGTDPDTGQPVTDQDWFGWSSASDAAGRTVREWSPVGGSAYEATTGVQAVRSDRLFSYDPAGRLVQVDDSTGAGDGAVCQRRGYGFDANGNRTAQSVATNPSACSDTGVTTSTRVFNTADQPTTPAGGAGSYTYDLLGRQTLIPAADTTNPAAGNITVVYDHTDAARTITQDTTSVAFTLDGAGRRLQQTTTVDGATTGVLTRHYTDGGDNPTWSVDTTGGQTVTTRYAALTGDGLGVTFTTTPTGNSAELTLTGLRGDIAATVPVDAETPADGIASWTEYTEYGQPTTTNPPTADTSVTPIGYGWLGGHERATLAGLGITLMGARLYNQATALFTSLDPVYGGGNTGYGYPTDPINQQDLDGRKWKSWWHKNGGSVLGYVALGACVFGGPVACGVATLASAAVSGWGRYKRYRREGRSVRSWRFAASTAFDFAGARISPLRGVGAAKFVAGGKGIRKVSSFRRSRFVGTAAGRWYKPSAYKAVARRHPWRFGGRAAYSAASGYKGYRGW